MDDTDGFLAEIIPGLRDAVSAMHEGDGGPWKALWSHEEPVTLFGAKFTDKGRANLEVLFDKLAAMFERSESVDYEVVDARVSGDLGYLTAIERSVCAGVGEDLESVILRVTMIFRREGGRWKAMHRHGDPLDDRVSHGAAG